MDDRVFEVGLKLGINDHKAKLIADNYEVVGKAIDTPLIEIYEIYEERCRILNNNKKCRLITRRQYDQIMLQLLHMLEADLFAFGYKIDDYNKLSSAHGYLHNNVKDVEKIVNILGD